MMMASLKWLCCCCHCWHIGSSSSDSESLDDASALVGHSSDKLKEPEISPFYVPRRHSSYNAGTFKPVMIQPCPNLSRSFSSTDEDDEIVPATHKRHWSFAPATNSTEMTSFSYGMSLKADDITPPWSPAMSSISSPDERNPARFDKHFLTGIVEVDIVTVQEPVLGTSSSSEHEDFGSLSFTTTYDCDGEKLKIFIKKACDLPTKGPLPYYDTYVKIQIIAVPRINHICRPVRKSQNPVYNEECVIRLSRSKWKTAQSHTLRLSVLDFDRRGKNDAIGHVLIPIKKIESEGIQTFGLPIAPMSLPIYNIGQVLLGIAYSPTQSILFVNVIKARNLRLDESVVQFNFSPFNREGPDTFVKVSLLCGGKKVKSSRSQIIRNCTNPVYSHKSNFVVPPQFAIDASVIVTVTVRGLLGRTVTLGRIVVGPYTIAADSTTLTHWGKMMREQRPITKWKTLCL